MGRSRRRKDSEFDALLVFLKEMPIWVGPLVALLVFAGLRWLVPWMLSSPDPDDLMGSTLHTVGSGVAARVAPWAGGVVLVVWIVAEIQKRTNRQRLDSQTGIQSIRQLTWRDFERLLAEAFRRQGYAVEHADGAGPDGGVDLRLRKLDEVVLVQCKHWQSVKVDVKTVRELNGVVASEGATAGIVVASGRFTDAAHDFAQKSHISLIGGDRLTEMIKKVQASQPSDQARGVLQAAQVARPACPTCGAPMTQRTAKKGSNAGSQFWGCTRYPACRGTRQLLEAG